MGRLMMCFCIVILFVHAFIRSHFGWQLSKIRQPTSARSAQAPASCELACLRCAPRRAVAAAWARTEEPDFTPTVPQTIAWRKCAPPWGCTLSPSNCLGNRVCAVGFKDRIQLTKEECGDEVDTWPYCVCVRCAPPGSLEVACRTRVHPSVCIMRLGLCGECSAGREQAENAAKQAEENAAKQAENAANHAENAAKQAEENASKQAENAANQAENAAPPPSESGFGGPPPSGLTARKGEGKDERKGVLHGQGNSCGVVLTPRTPGPGTYIDGVHIAPDLS